jgi:hypothetical protein
MDSVIAANGIRIIDKDSMELVKIQHVTSIS